MPKTKPPANAQFWVQVIAFFLLLVFLIVITFLRSELQDDLVRLLFALLVGFATIFIGGRAFLTAEAHTDNRLRFSLSATAGLAMFALVYLVPPYWFQKREKAPTPENRSSPTPTQTPASTASMPTLTPSPIVYAPSPSLSPLKPTPVPSPLGTPNLPQATPVQTVAQATPQIVQVTRTGRVLLLIEEPAVLQKMLNKLADYGLQPVSGQELGAGEVTRIKQSLRQVQAGNATAGANISYAVVITGEVTNASLGEAQGAFLVEATANIKAIVIPSGEVLHGDATARGGGPARETATRSATRELAASIPEIFFRQVTMRAR